MKTLQPIDVDDLLSSCRADNAKRAFGEAVAAYRAGAYRACIVVTWTAVVFDYVGKLRELELAGNGEAEKALVAWEGARKANDIPTALRLEELLLEEAEKRFELLTPIERADLERLRQDRHRCAHPSLLTLDEPYQPSAELARVHMRHAVLHLLSRPPVQGKEAWDRVQADISSEYFPDDEDVAAARLHTIMSRARPTLVRKVAVELTRQLLEPDRDDRVRLFAALRGLAKLHHSELEQLLREKLPSLVERMKDEQLALLINYCARIDHSWDALGPATQGRLRLFVERTESMAALAEAWRALPLRSLVSDRLSNLSAHSVAELACAARDPLVLDEVVRRFEESMSFSTFAALRVALTDDALELTWSAEQTRRLIVACRANKELRRYGGYSPVIRRVLALSERSQHDEVRGEWRTLYDTLSPAGLIAEKIRGVYPEFPGPEQGEVTEAASGEA